MNTTKKTEETLNFLRVARKSQDGVNGFLYIHHWGTGWQYLIFDSKESADRLREKFNTPEYEAFLKTKA